MMTERNEELRAAGWVVSCDFGSDQHGDFVEVHSLPPTAGLDFRQAYVPRDEESEIVWDVTLRDDGHICRPDGTTVD